MNRTEANQTPTPAQLVAFAIQGTGMRVELLPDTGALEVVYPVGNRTIRLGVLLGSLLRSILSVDLRDAREYDPGFRGAIRAVLAAEAARRCCDPLTPKDEQEALQVLLLRLTAPAEEAAIRRAAACQPDEPLRMVAAEVARTAEVADEYVEVTEAYKAAFPELANEILPGDTILSALLPLLQARLTAAKPDMEKVRAAMMALKAELGL